MGKAPGPSHAGLGCLSQVPLQPPRGPEVSTEVPPGTLGRQIRDVVSRAWTSGHSSRGLGEWGEGQTESRQQARSCCLQLSPGDQ